MLAATLVNTVSRSACSCAGQVSPCCHSATPFWDTHIRNSPSGACAIPLSYPLQLVLSSLTPNIDNDRKYRGSYRRGEPQKTSRPQEVVPNT